MGFQPCIYTDRSHMIVEHEKGHTYREYIDDHEYKFVKNSSFDREEYIFRIEEGIPEEERTFENLMKITNQTYSKKRYPHLNLCILQEGVTHEFEDYENGHMRRYGWLREVGPLPILIDPAATELPKPPTGPTKTYKEGTWIFDHPDGNRFTTTYYEDKKHGWSTHKYPNGNYTEYLYEYDKLLGERVYENDTEVLVSAKADLSPEPQPLVGIEVSCSIDPEILEKWRPRIFMP